MYQDVHPVWLLLHLISFVINNPRMSDLNTVMVDVTEITLKFLCEIFSLVTRSNPISVVYLLSVDTSSVP